MKPLQQILVPYELRSSHSNGLRSDNVKDAIVGLDIVLVGLVYTGIKE